MTRPIFAAVPEKDCMALQADYRFTIGNQEFWIPTGFKWNGASIPQALWSEMGGRFEPNTIEASLPHDWLYLGHGTDRETADRYFYEQCRAAGMPHLKAAAMYEALHLFGETHWPTSEEDRKQISEIKEMLSIREDKDKFLATMLTASEA
jgi:hypothetical protein